MTKRKKQPSPGSDAAIESGCCCPVMDNGHGRGYMGMKGVFVMRADCPMHGHEGSPPTEGVSRSFSSEK